MSRRERPVKRDEEAVGGDGCLLDIGVWFAGQTLIDDRVDVVPICGEQRTDGDGGAFVQLDAHGGAV